MRRKQILLTVCLSAVCAGAAAQMSKVEFGDCTMTTFGEDASETGVKVAENTTNVENIVCWGDKTKSGGGNAVFYINGEEKISKAGCTGAKNNPSFTGGAGFGEGTCTAMPSGYRIELKTKTAGIMYIFHKASYNKGYGVIAGQGSLKDFTGIQQGFQHNLVCGMPSSVLHSSYDKTGDNATNVVSDKVQVLHCHATAWEPTAQGFVSGTTTTGSYKDVDAKDRTMPGYMADEVKGGFTAQPVKVTISVFEQKTGYFTANYADLCDYSDTKLFENKAANGADPIEKTTIKDATPALDALKHSKNTNPVFRKGTFAYGVAKITKVNNADVYPALAPSNADANDKGEKKRYQQISIQLTIAAAVEAQGSTEAKAAVTLTVPECTEYYTAAPADNALAGTLKNTAELAAMFTNPVDAEPASGTFVKASDNKFYTYTAGTAIYREAPKAGKNPSAPSLGANYAEWNTNNPIMTEDDWAFVGLPNATDRTPENINSNPWFNAGFVQVKVPQYYKPDGVQKMTTGLSGISGDGKASSGVIRFRCAKKDIVQVAAQGSKMSFQGFVFVPEGVAADMCIIAENCLLFRDKISTKGYIKNMTDDEVSAYWAKCEKGDDAPAVPGSWKVFSPYELNALVTRGVETSDKGEFLLEDGSGNLAALKTIKELKAEDPNAPIYNLQGQVVGKGYKGIAIQNGKKFLVK